MDVSLVLTVMSPDRPGIVELLSETIVAHDGNWLESRMSRLGGQFAGILRVNVPATRADELADALHKLASRDLRVVIEKSATAESADDDRSVSLELIGNDREGIVRDISRVLVRMGVNVEELSTACASAPMSGAMLFKANIKLRLPGSRSVNELRQALEALANDLMVDITLEDSAIPTA